ncbi:MAG TPA: hypothetical protein PLY87_24505 [Planctomycetaceae bacterium]|nr:hypothetical protein [Planctomycetaceae bacterium]
MKVRLIRFQLSPFASNFKRGDIVNHIDRLTTRGNALPVSLSEATALHFPAKKCGDGFVIQRIPFQNPDASKVSASPRRIVRQEFDEALSGTPIREISFQATRES